MPKHPKVVKKAHYASQKHVTLSQKGGEKKEQVLTGKKHKPSKGVKKVGSKVGFGAQTMSAPAHARNARALKAFQMAKSSDGADLASLHMKGKKGKSSAHNGY